MKIKNLFGTGGRMLNLCEMDKGLNELTGLLTQSLLCFAKN